MHLVVLRTCNVLGWKAKEANGGRRVRGNCTRASEHGEDGFGFAAGLCTKPIELRSIHHQMYG